jgi:tRNA modification GTPase
VERASVVLREACQAVDASHPPDLLATLLMEAASLLGRVTGDTADADLLEEIFSRFCIGK